MEFLLIFSKISFVKVPKLGALWYKMKYWQEYYLVEHIEKHFGGINIGDLDSIVAW